MSATIPESVTPPVIGNWMKPGVVSTSGLLTLRDARTMTTDLHARPAGRRRSWPELDWGQRRGTMLQMASHRPRANWASVPRAGVVLPRHPPPQPARKTGWKVRRTRRPLPGL